jgi:hypothetical protein
METQAPIHPAPLWSGPPARRHRCAKTLAVAFAGVAMLAAGGALLASPKAAAAAPVTVSIRSHLSGPFGLDTTVGLYRDCSGKTELTDTAAAIDTCVTDQTYFVGHNLGVFTPVMLLGVGDVVTYTDATGMRHPWTVTAIHDEPINTPPSHDAGVVAQMQTCTLQGSWRIVDLGMAR